MDAYDDTALSAVSRSGSTALPECAVIISNLADLLQHFGIRDQPDIVRTTIETLAKIARLCTAGMLTRVQRATTANISCVH